MQYGAYIKFCIYADATTHLDGLVHVTKKRKTNAENVFKDITNVNLGNMHGVNRQVDNLEVMDQKIMPMEDNQSVFRWRRGWQTNVPIGK